jgi:iron complex outermembrane receptor protein
MRGFLFIIAALTLLPSVSVTAGNDPVGAGENGVVQRLDSVVVSASRAGSSTPVTFTMLSSPVLRRANPINSIPMMLGLQPSVVTTNEGGTGLGYSKMTVRGSKGSQINVTLNGITLNDAESQEVFWVNIPALGSILNSVQVQRGLGTSSNGAGAFGASINMNTAFVGVGPSASAEISRGSFNTMMTTVSASTGLSRSGLYLTGVYSRDYTDGYIRNAKAKEQSAFAVIGYLKGNNSLRLTYLMGDQHTGITWEGIPLAKYSSDRRYNPSGEYMDAKGNVHYYDNQTDNYTQHHLQFNYSHQFTPSLAWSNTFNYTRGDGYDEQYETDTQKDSITRRKMSNDYLVLNSVLEYSSESLECSFGANLSRYYGRHFGDVLWDSVRGDGFDYSSLDWYRNKAVKSELNLSARAEYHPFGWLTGYVDLQYRGIDLTMSGPDDIYVPLDYSKRYDFFNPRAGVTFSWADGQKLYASVAFGHREPGRGDLKESIETVSVEKASGDASAKVGLKAERMADTEVGYSFSSEHFSAQANVYFMEYRDMLLETGKLSVAGYAIKDNVPQGYRRGLEMSLAWKPDPMFTMEGNLTLSRNKIKDYTAYVDQYDNENDWNFLGQAAEQYHNTDMLMSPSAVGMLQMIVNPFLRSAGSLKHTTFSVSGKYVGRQYWDNTQCAERKVPSYCVCDLSVTHQFSLKGGTIVLGGYINNLLNNHYFADAWVYRAHFNHPDKDYQQEGVYPAAPVNGMLKVTYIF